MAERDYIERTIETVRIHRDADNSWPQWANVLADEIERLWAEREQIDGECLAAVGTEEHVLASRIRDILRAAGT